LRVTGFFILHNKARLNRRDNIWLYCCVHIARLRLRSDPSLNCYQLSLPCFIFGCGEMQVHKPFDGYAHPPYKKLGVLSLYASEWGRLVLSTLCYRLTTWQTSHILVHFVAILNPKPKWWWYCRFPLLSFVCE
jgi:hypothetical protein